jgi:hypothetical protein
MKGAPWIAMISTDAIKSSATKGTSHQYGPIQNALINSPAVLKRCLVAFRKDFMVCSLGLEYLALSAARRSIA